MAGEDNTWLVSPLDYPPSVDADHIAETNIPRAVETLELQLLDRAIVARTRIDRHTW
jgi:hypothetical protein